MKNTENKKVYIYDGSYQGLLTALYQAFKLREVPIKIVAQAEFKDDLFYQQVEVKTENEKAQFFSDQIKEHISAQTLNNIFHAYLSEAEKMELYIFRYLFTGFKVGKKVDEFLTKDYVRQVQDLAHKVRHESHRLKGLIRLQEAAGGKYYAAVEPDYKTLVLMAPHFKNRFSTMDWIIHDKKREEAVIYSAAEKEWLVIDLEKEFEPELSNKEKDVQQLWQAFFSAVSIKNRSNPRTQRQFMPKKYWKHLIESPGSSRKFKIK
ncbi:putative DNA metabolism protein [Halanaerobium saccharolyticum]|uniref:Putative DNA metabolism protein n=1 Tax=Halanaerobium saccharolyticum TaxID=43595 RepID=A0A4V3G569_9FIRM|nr:TIGR03915 family putative DNA repair protein [Halanaerobium saccharolyticum]RAK08437.1 putative DNA metabolism protein [Halanaerobium saccharolyticum]TDW03528.1 putative DNA metabolism protein [Halanaerobium saccharolyticum]TDX59929.1 putative DNA metabolism protein [Halanaerobium saccharolyticum]